MRQGNGLPVSKSRTVKRSSVPCAAL